MSMARKISREPLNIDENEFVRRIMQEYGGRVEINVFIKGCLTCCIQVLREVTKCSLLAAINELVKMLESVKVVSEVNVPVADEQSEEPSDANTN